MSFEYFSKNGVILPVSDALIPLENIAYQYGFGVYETLKVRNRIIYFVRQHVERLLQSAKIIGLDHAFVHKQIESYIYELNDKLEAQSCNIKILLIGGKTAGDSLLFILPLAPIFPDRKLYTKGATVEAVVYERFLPNAKTLNMLPSYLFYTKAKKNGHYDALFLDKQNNILEGTRTNFFVIKGNTLITPPKEKVLEGVTMQTVIAVATENGFEVKEEEIIYSKLSSFDGAFLTSTSSKIIPIIQIDDLKFSEIPLEVKRLMKLYDEFLDKSKGVFTG